jgi:pimeloyl-ACP methyl ester carboxylesterase
MSDDVLAVVDVLDHGPLFGFGHSMGGAALVLAELARPGTFRAMYLYEPVLIPSRVYPTTIESNPMAAAAIRRRPLFGSRVAAFENYASKPPLNELREDALRAYVEHGFRERADGTVELKCTPADEAETFRFGASTGAFERLGELRCSVTIARGVPESFGPAAFAQAQAEALAAGRFVTFDDLGHFGPLQDPPRIAASMIDALLAG